MREHSGVFWHHVAVEQNASTSPRKRRDGVLTREVDGEFVLLNTQAEQIHQLNCTASFIWRACDGNTSAEEIAHALAIDFEVEEDAALADVLEALRRFEGLELLVPVGSCGTSSRHS